MTKAKFRKTGLRCRSGIEGRQNREMTASSPNRPEKHYHTSDRFEGGRSVMAPTTQRSNVSRYKPVHLIFL
jgi:hypothetical protein